MKKVIILGDKGMLGHMVKKYLKQYYTIITIPNRWPDQKFKSAIQETDADFLVNCIGAIPQKTDQYEVNTELPIWLENNFEGRIIHPGTDCEIDNDSYGNSKREASDYLKENGTKTKIIKTSIIGPELKDHSSLLDWFLYNQDKKVYGYEEAMWSGVTTLTWAKECSKLLNNWDDYEKETILESTCISKYNLLSLLKEIFDKNIEIEAVLNKGKDKCLKGKIVDLSIKEQLYELKEFYYGVGSKS